MKFSPRCTISNAAVQRTAGALTKQRPPLRVRCRAQGGAEVWAERQSPDLWRRVGAVGLSAVLLFTPIQDPPPALAAGQAGVSPWDEGKRILLGPTADGRVRPCGINPNCLSTANLDDLYGPPWRSPDTKPAAAAAVLEQAVPAAIPGAELVRAMTLEDGAEYRAWTVNSLFGDDVLEVVLRGDLAPSTAAADQQRDGEGRAEGQLQRARGREERGVLATYRSQAGSLKFLYPFQTPISDGGQQKKRLDALRRELGWPIEGCSYLECYMD